MITAEVNKARDLAGGVGAAAERAEKLLKWYQNGSNNYTAERSNLILPELTKQVADIIKPVQ